VADISVFSAKMWNFLENRLRPQKDAGNKTRTRRAGRDSFIDDVIPVRTNDDLATDATKRTNEE